MRLTEEFQRTLPDIDLVVFDIDGVLIDTSESFPEAIVKAVYRYGQLVDIPGWAKPAREAVAAFKRVPGFNNDWDLAEGLLVFNLINRTTNRNLSLDEFLTKVNTAGTGLAGVRNWITGLDTSEKREIGNLYDSGQIRQLAMEYYAGEEYCEQLYGFQPKYGISPGTIENETLFVEADQLNSLRPEYELGIYTGRDPDETAVALQNIGFHGFNENCIVTDDGRSPTKPDPAPLMQMLEKTSGSGVMFVGDSLDDYNTITGFREVYNEIPAEFVQVSRELRPFEPGINIVSTVEELIEVLIHSEETELEKP